jgi:hypothetical protein
MDTKTILLDIVKHTAGLGLIQTIKIVSTDKKTTLDAMDPDKTVILQATMHSPVTEFEGEFGMGNLGYLSSLAKQLQGK